MGIIITVIFLKRFIIGTDSARIYASEPATRIKVELICIASLTDARSFCVSKFVYLPPNGKINRLLQSEC